MSTLKADTIQSTGGGAATLTKQSAAKLTYAFNQSATTYFGMSTNTGSSQAINVSGYTDRGTGLAQIAITSAFSNAQYIYNIGAIMTNNTVCIDATSNVSTASALEVKYTDADTSNVADNLHYGSLHGDLA